MHRVRTFYATVLTVVGLAALTLTPPSVSLAPAAVAAVNPPTTLYALDPGHQTVVRFVGGPTGAVSTTVIGRNLDAVTGLAADAAGNVTLINHGRLVRISTDGCSGRSRRTSPACGTWSSTSTGRCSSPRPTGCSASTSPAAGRA